MTTAQRRILACTCRGTMPLDEKALNAACGQAVGTLHTELCRAGIDSFRRAAAEGNPFIVACTQEAPLFTEVMEEDGSDAALTFTNIREQAGWSEQARGATPKMAALLAEAMIEIEPASSVTLKSEGVCLVYGRDEQAIEAARQLSARLDVTVLLDRPQGVLPPRIMDLPIFQGSIVGAKGHLGAFEIMVNNYAPADPSSRQVLAFEPGKNGAASQCDLILDLSGGAPLFPSHERRDGYFRPDPGNPAALQKMLLEMTDMVGEFTKPRYVDFRADLCAHSRSKQIGCTRCLDVCPASAITPGAALGIDTVSIDPYLCGGCGACHSVCPTGAASYAMPSGAAILTRLRSLLTTYREAGGVKPVILVHDERSGAEMISMMARFGRGLPSNVIPFAVNEVTQTGLDLLAGALAYGASQVAVLVSPAKRGELTGLAQQAGIIETAMSGLGYDSGRVAVLVEDDPDAVEAALYSLPAVAAIPGGDFLAMGGKRSSLTLAFGHLHDVAPAPVDTVQLAAGAPFGAVVVDVEGCTLCLSCVSACPTGALHDNEDRPFLGFQEDACVQCGLCKNTCPEQVITLSPRLNFTAAARSVQPLKEEEPYHCVRCSKPFGTKGSVERIVAKLEGHSMFADPAALERIKMCQDCRVIAQFEGPANPMAGKPRPLTRTTDDYLRERDEAETAKKDDPTKV
ncbi:MAG: 4Fe-4S binding protein [Alphaproteobacteria bacterium]|nr:4Fe-4S binding protein [Alphaproteobacteria bacterium]MBU0799032.1 4Fe-4S binding protein [Alphaproteobacteria bacterium]MBU0889262.1 4Fe-4S binding protein [Alphaproteobacteria bacterium]MBU1815078.1 4Fe-4S binding protein [Alphaproteobacteria bacterium]MBU2089133.1 4Fe-4S binding protein [Alphaproteobacteria bacterium]